jgi:signal recognition particle subunit SRP54
MKMMSSGGAREKMAALQQMQGMMSNNPMNPMQGMSLKQSTGKRLTPKERERLQKERDKALRKAKRKN